MVPITALYAGILALIATALGGVIGPMRARTGISILHGENMVLATAIRRHGNFIESVPIALILLGFLELNGASPGLLHGLGIALVLCRIAHPIGLKHDNVRHPLRGIGAGGTALVTLIAAVMLIWGYFSR
ncbi:MAG TPA: MAPEG family protein [Myxococcota bacterium]|nr:MAPEG family protein [Myxococcota bacterium]